MKPYELTITEALKEIKSGALSSEELTHSCLERIDTVEESVSAFISYDGENAIEQAKAADEQLKKEDKEQGMLLGMPLGMKDLLCTSGSRTTCGSLILESFVPPYDATVV